jgi:hypothetical protein
MNAGKWISVHQPHYRQPRKVVAVPFALACAAIICTSYIARSILAYPSLKRGYDLCVCKLTPINLHTQPFDPEFSIEICTSVIFVGNSDVA